MQGVLIGVGLAILLTYVIAGSAVLRTSSKANGWTAPMSCSVPGGLTLEGGCALIYPTIDPPTEAIYWTSSKDGAGAALDGTKNYILHFPTGQTPPVKAFWSITIGKTRRQLINWLPATGVMVANPEHKYSVSSHSNLATNADGSTDIYLGPTAPAGHKANWLPTRNGDVMLWLRMYEPEESALEDGWTPPAIKEIKP